MCQNIPGLSVLSAAPASGSGPPNAPSSIGCSVSPVISPSSGHELFPGAPLGGFAAGVPEASPVTFGFFAGGSV